MPRDQRERRRWEEMRQMINLNAAAYDYYDMMIANITPMLVYDDLPAHGVEMQTLIENAAAVGVAGVCEIDGQYRCGILHWSDVINDNGIADSCILSGSFWAKEFKTDEIAYFRFTHTQNPASHLKWMSRQFANVDDSQRCMVRNTKYTPIPVVPTEPIRAAYEDAMKRQQRGEDITIIVNPTTHNLFNDGTNAKESDRVLNIGDAAMIEKMHFLSEYHAELKKRYAAMYGMCFKTSAKSAQESLDEIHGMDNFSLIVPYNMREEMRLFADKCKKLWSWQGRDAVHFGELWEREDNDAKHGEDEKPQEEKTQEVTVNADTAPAED